ncbi:hypothetical protein CAP36_14325 [Chitinophagaceae bacterium IBVUCB2]|nr:hypothetical protein CAP36_14325 [Chitinophagaceae bacterium IBVUCB2]
MANSHFQFKQFTIHQDKCAMKVTTDSCLFGAWAAEKVKLLDPGINKGLDIGTGTGLLSLMLAQQSNIYFDALEIDVNATKQAQENVLLSPWKERINVLNFDAIEFSNTTLYDLIISNPPFYENELKGKNSGKNIAHHDGGLLLPELLSIIKRNLAANGVFLLLLPYKRHEEIRKLFTEHELVIEQITFVKQSVNHDYFRIMLAGRLQSAWPAETIINDIAIKSEDDKYTPAFTELLKDYYLYL